MAEAEAAFAEEPEAEAPESEEDAEENAMSLSAMEQALMPSVLETFDAIADTYKKLAKVQEKRLAALQGGEEIPVRKGDFWRTPGGVPHTLPGKGFGTG